MLFLSKLINFHGITSFLLLRQKPSCNGILNSGIQKKQNEPSTDPRRQSAMTFREVLAKNGRWLLKIESSEKKGRCLYPGVNAKWSKNNDVFIAHQLKCLIQQFDTKLFGSNTWPGYHITPIAFTLLVYIRRIAPSKN